MVIERDSLESKGDVFTSTTTPSTNETLANATIGPKFVIPIIFIPGIMGSNVESLDGKQVWFPANGALSGLGSAIYGGLARSARDRQSELDPENTRVSSNGAIKIKKSDKVGITEETARARGWGSVWWTGYGPGLIFLERYLNKELIAASNNTSLPDFESAEFVGSEPWRLFTSHGDKTDPSIISNLWNPTKAFELLNIDEFEDLADYAFPVFAEGYNWLQNNAESARLIADNMAGKVKAQVAKEFPKATFKKFIIVTHSMGGLVARSIIQNPSVQADIHGVIHGVMPASGAPTVYKRLATGWDGYNTTGNVIDMIAKHVFGATAEKLTPVLANSPGGMSLLPFVNFRTTHESDPNTKIQPWLRLIARNMKGEKIVATLPNSDPFEEIYGDTASWWRMVNLDMLDPNGSIGKPSGSSDTSAVSGSVVGLGGVPDSSPSEEAPDPQILVEAKLLATVQMVQRFQLNISDSYHANTFAHYGNDPKHLAFNEVVWETDQQIEIETPDDLIAYQGVSITEKGEQSIDPETGRTKLPTIVMAAEESKNLFKKDGERRISRKGKPDVVFKLNIKPNPKTGFGDGTVCNQSAADVDRDTAKQVFLINGYEHSASYGNEGVLKSVLYSVAKLVKLI